MGYLRVRDLGKAYKRYPNKSGRLIEWLGGGVHHELHWVLRGISFDIAPGEAVAIAGANGAGKSTLLKLITGTIQPTTGTYDAGGRVAALLELGIGFQPDFSGRQNVEMAAHLRGVPVGEMGSLVEEVIAFSEIGDYFDQPLRTYSSGMQVRLAFSVATAVRPDILIVDEALSVGDSYFQHKSFGRIRQFRDAGTTLLFVSHSPGAVKSLCDRAILLDKGVMLRDGPPDAVLDYYNALVATQRADYEIREVERETGKLETRSGSFFAMIEKVDLLVDGKSVRSLQSCAPSIIEVTFLAQQDLDALTVGILIRDRFGNDVFGTNTFHHDASLVNLKAGTHGSVHFEIAEMALGVGNYSLTVALHTRDDHVASNFDWWDQSLVFQVFPGERPASIGVCNLRVVANSNVGQSALNSQSAHCLEAK